MREIFQRLRKTVSLPISAWAIVAIVLIGVGCSSPLPGTIGAALGKRTDGRVFVRRVPAGEGADKAGLMVDDEIIAIDGKSVREMTEEDIKRAVRGDLGSTFTVTIVRGGDAKERRDIKVERSPLLPASAMEKK